MTQDPRYAFTLGLAAR